MKDSVEVKSFFVWRNKGVGIDGDMWSCVPDVGQAQPRDSERCWVAHELKKQRDLNYVEILTMKTERLTSIANQLLNLIKTGPKYWGRKHPAVDLLRTAHRAVARAERLMIAEIVRDIDSLQPNHTLR